MLLFKILNHIEQCFSLSFSLSGAKPEEVLANSNIAVPANFKPVCDSVPPGGSNYISSKFEVCRLGSIQKPIECFYDVLWNSLIAVSIIIQFIRPSVICTCAILCYPCVSLRPPSRSGTNVQTTLSLLGALILRLSS